MAFHSARCPACGKQIQVPDDSDVSLCMYCGQPVVVSDVVRHPVGPNVANLLGMARTAAIAGNEAEAESYFNRVLELDPTVSEAWIGKGKAAGWQSSLKQMRFGEVVVAFNHAIATATEDNRTATAEKCMSELNRLVAALYKPLKAHLDEYVALPQTWVLFVEQTGHMISALEAARIWSQSDRTRLENIVHLCGACIEGVAYRDKFHDNIPKAWTITPAYEAKLRVTLAAATDELQGLDPSYSAPVVQKKQADSCFVVTATMGNARHPTVSTLRDFRDHFLLQHRAGRHFIAWYYRHGPKIATVIARSDTARVASFLIIVSPAAWLARRILRR